VGFRPLIADTQKMLEFSRRNVYYSFIPKYQKLTEVVYRYDANTVLQLVYCGLYVLTDISDGTKLGQSAVENPNNHITPAVLQQQDIEEVQESFARAAFRAKQAGFDGVEIDGAHGFLLSQFLTPYYNHRTDKYGGIDENRARMLIETCQCVKERVGSNYPVFVKINCTDGMNDGISMQGFLTACEMLKPEWTPLT
jgi:2,4-dienoyl-CoA reductase-like NADH-dependent reductase (Old Yellow Enzyme family)